MKIRVQVAAGILFIDVSKIASIISEAPYSYLYLTDQTRMFCSQPIKYFDELLNENGFVRVHKSSLVNVLTVSIYQPEGNGLVKLTNGQKVLFARGKKRQFMDVVDTYCL